MAAVLIVDEQVQGYRKEYEDISALRKDINALIDERVTEIKVKKRAPIKGDSMRKPENSNDTLMDYTKIVVETDEELPKAVAEITADNIIPADGYRVRLTPKYN